MKISTVSIYGFFSILFLSFLLSACGNKAQEKTSKTDEKIKTQTNDVKIPILLDLNKTFPEREVNYQDIAEVEYVPLETKDNVLIGQRNRILITNNSIICCNRGKDEFLFFDKKGHFVKSFCHKGGSGEEYQNVMGLAYDEKSDELFVNDSFHKQKVLVYSSNGQFKRKFQTRDRLNELMIFDDKNLIARKCYLWEEDLENPKKSKDYLLLSRKDGSISSTIDLDNINKIPTMLDREDLSYFPIKPNDIVRFKNGFILADISSDTIYKMGLDLKLMPFIIRQPAIQKVNQTTLLNQVLCMTDKYAILAKSNYSFGPGIPTIKQIYEIVVDLKKNDVFNAKFINKDFPTNENFLYFFTDIKTPENTAASLLEASDLLEALDEDKLSGPLKKIALTLKEDDNPVVILLKFK